MLRITQQSSSDAAKQYYASADYYAEGQEIIGRWGGEGARMLGLEGPVSKRAFNALCENRDPRTGERLTPRTKDDRTVGYDFTWSVPKSVSLLYALTEDPEVLAAFRDSVHETMGDIEAEMKARVRKDGRNEERTTGNLAYGEFVHFTSRPVQGVPDPQLHAHSFVFNATFDREEQQWKAGQFRDLKRDAPYWQAAFRARLANRLQALGYAIDRKRDDFEIRGIEPATIRRFSRRTDKIEELAREKGIEDPEAKARLGALSRERKDKSLSWAELTREWDKRLTPAERQAILTAKGQPGTGPAAERGDAASVDFAVRHVFEREAVVPEKRLLAEALKHGLGSVTVEGVRREYARRPLLVEQRGGARMVTTPEVLAEEDHLVAFAREGRGTRQPLGVPGRPLQRDWLNEGQRQAVQHILSSRDRVILLRGAAGTGKTTLMQEAVEAIGEGGRQVVVLAPSAGASRDVLRTAGFKDADTVAMFLKCEAMQQRAAGQVIWVDEAGLLNSQDTAALFDIAKRVNARVILMGDRKQHSSPSRGSPLKLLEEEAGVPSVAVTEIMRQDGDYKKAVRLVSEDKVAEGFDELDRLGWVQEVADDKRYLRLAEAYLHASAEKKPDGEAKTALVVSPTHVEGQRITEVIRGALAAKGQLGEEREFLAWRPLHLTQAERGEAASYAAGDMLQFHQNAKGFKNGERLLVGDQPLPLDQAGRFQVYRPEAMRLALGDRLRVTAGGKTADGRHRLNNGALYTVRGFTPGGDLVVDNGWVIGKDFGHIAYGYVVTSHASQGKTVDKVLIGQSQQSLPASDRQQLYVSVSRGREQAVIFTDDKKALREAASRDRERLTATEVFRPRKPAGRERLKRHLSFLRQWASQQRPRERAGRDHAAIKKKEATHER
ncbi:MAG TPA: MobF family relaxase [Gemmataceae bacterium]|nr:MobF family relaxase [Gemmataceae bacterium]